MTKTKSLLLTAGIVLATAFTFCGCKEEAKEKKETPSAEATTEATAEKDEAGVIDFKKLTLKDGVYYLNNAPFTGKASYEGDDVWGTKEFKDGKLHGKDVSYVDSCETIAHYKDGKKHGKWVGSCAGEEPVVEIWENDVLISGGGISQ